MVAVDGEVAVDAEVEDVVDADRVVVAVDVEVEDVVNADRVGVAAVAAVTPEFGRTGGPHRGFGCTTSSVGTRDRSPDPVGSDDFEGVDCGITLLDVFLGEIAGGIVGESIEYIE